MKNLSAFVGLSFLSAIVLSGCSPAVESNDTGGDTPSATSDDLSIIVSTTVLGSLVSDLAICATGDASAVQVVMPIGADPHDFQPSSEQVAAMAGAQLVVLNGLGLEEGLLPAVESIETDGANILEVAPLLDPIPFGMDGGHDHGEEEHAEEEHDHGEEEHAEEEHDHGEEEHAEEEHDHDHSGDDPHFWLDMNRMALTSTIIGEELETAGASGFAACGDELAQSIRAAETSVIETLAAIPADRRVLVTDHDAFGYFAERYDFEIVGAVIPGGSTLGSPDSEELASLVSIIQDEDVPAIFGNEALSESVLEVVSAEAGRDVTVELLFVGSLGGPESGASTYIEMMTTNANRIADALTR